MSNYLAVAAVTESLAHIIREAVTPVIPGVLVSTYRPDRAGKDPAPRVNIYLYQTAPSPALRNAGMPMRDASGQLVDTPATPLDLFYLVTFYGPDEQLVPQQLLALSVAAVHTNAVLTPDALGAALRAAQGGYLDACDLAYQRELVKLNPLVLNLEEISKLWQIMFQVPYTLTVAYQASVVLLTGGPVPAALPVRTIGAAPSPAMPPCVDAVTGEGGGPLLAGGTAAITGRGLGGPGAVVTVGGVPVPVLPASTDTRVLATLRARGLRAGPVTVRVAGPAGVSAGTGATLLPVLASVKRTGGSLRLSILPPPGPEQRVTLLLNEIPSKTHAARGAFAFDAPRPLPTPPPKRKGSTVTVPFQDVPAGTYAVRVAVDDARSPLTPSTPGGPMDTPSVTLP